MIRILTLLLAFALPLGAAAMAPGSGRIEIAEPAGATADPMPLWYHRPAAWAPDAKEQATVSAGRALCAVFFMLSVLSIV